MNRNLHDEKMRMQVLSLVLLQPLACLLGSPQFAPWIEYCHPTAHPSGFIYKLNMFSALDNILWISQGIEKRRKTILLKSSEQAAHGIFLCRDLRFAYPEIIQFLALLLLLLVSVRADVGGPGSPQTSSVSLNVSVIAPVLESAYSTECLQLDA